ncbi:MAG: polyhydroxyalkanoate depolymerase [Alphaproteobacteria bacterium]|nr:polyhydroxyalkanoate depolymerase [Alphaproteobacteria bacterium]
MLYHFFDFNHAMLAPVRMSAELMRTAYQHPMNPLSYTQGGRSLAASAEIFERVTRRFDKPSFDLPTTLIDGQKIEIEEQVVVEKPFANLLHFRRKVDRHDPKVLIVAPMSGHYATLLRGTVQALLPHHDVYITDWHDARQVPLTEGRFNLDDYIAYVREFLSLLGSGVHVIAVCQPAVPVFAAVALMEADDDPALPLTMTLMGGPIDARVSPTRVNEMAERNPGHWLAKTVVTSVPFYYPGAFRKVYPGFVQLGSFVSMNLDRHIGSHMKFFQHLVEGDGDSAETHRNFYDEYLSVMDIPGEFYLQTVDVVFQRYLLPQGKMVWKNPLNDQTYPVDPRAIKRTVLLTIEGELDDISANGQTTAAHELALNLPSDRQYHHFQEKTGHYGIFNGRKWREEIMPRIRHMIRQFDPDTDPVPPADLAMVSDKAPAQWNRSEHGIDAVNKRRGTSAPRSRKEMESAE